MSTPPRLRLLRATRIESRALLIATACFVIGGVVGLVAFGEAVPIAGRGSLGDAAALTGAVLALAVFTLGFLLDPVRRAEFPGRFGVRILDVAALALAHAAIVLLAWSVVFAVVQEAFIDAVVFPLAAAALLGATTALAGYVVFLNATSITTPKMAGALCLFLVLGVLTSMLTAPDPYWWQMNFSALGAGAGFSTATFNLTLIVSGVLITTLAHFLTRELDSGPLARVDAPTPATATRRVAGLRTGLVVIGIFLACVGIFPVDVIEPVHNAVATGMLVVWGVLVFRIHKLVPGLSRTFLVIGYAFFGIVVAATVAFFSGYYNLTAVELLGFALIFTWLFVLVRNISAAAADAADSPAEVAAATA